MNIEVGQVWETRCGGQVSVIGPSDRAGYPWKIQDGLHQYTVTNDGRQFACGPSAQDLVRLITTAPINLTEQTIDTFARIVRNGGKVPDGYTLQLNAKENRERDGWVDRRPVEVNFNDLLQLNVRLRQIDLPKPDPIPQPPRFSVSTDPIGVLDSQQPGMYAKFKNALDAAKFVVDKLNRGERVAGDYEWKPLPVETIPIDETDVIVGKTLIRTKYGTCLVLTVSSDGVSYAMPCFDEKADRKQSTLKSLADAGRIYSQTLIDRATWITLQKQAEYSNDQGATWAKCEKPKP